MTDKELRQAAAMAVLGATAGKWIGGGQWLLVETRPTAGGVELVGSNDGRRWHRLDFKAVA